MRRRTPRIPSLLLALLATASLVAAGCSEEDQEELEDTATSVQEEVEDEAVSGAAVAAAKALETNLKADESDEELRSVSRLEESAEDLPGDPEITGIDDGDGDGLDDDGKVEVVVEDKQACLTVPEQGDETSVDEGAC